MDIVSIGQIVGPSDVLATLPKRAFRVKSWNDASAPKTQELTLKACKKAKAFVCSVFDDGAIDGGLYRLFVYRTQDESRACWKTITE